MRISDWSSDVCSSDLTALYAAPMDPAAFARIARRIADASLVGLNEGDILADFCTALNEVDIPVSRAVLGADTLHPVLAGRIFGWKRDEAGIILHEFGRSTTEEGERKWRESPFHHLEQTGAAQLRVRIDGHNGEFPLDRKSTRLNSSHSCASRMPSSA